MGTNAFLDEAEAQEVYLVKAFEEADPEGRWLRPEVRREATAAALAHTGQTSTGQTRPGQTRAGQTSTGRDGAELSTPTAAARAAARRAAALLPDLDTLAPMFPGLRRVTRLGSGLGPLVALAALVAGLLANALGPLRQVNLLSVPLLGALGWNLLVYLGFASVWLLRGRNTFPGQGLGRLLAPLLTLGYLRRAAARLRVETPEKAAVVGRATSAYLTSWRAVSAPLVAARGRRLMHLAALCLVLGMVAGMYARGLIFEYRATWESTFLDAAGVHRLLALVLGPASALLGVPVAPAEVLETLRAPGSGEAAPWIHLYAVTAALVVVLPRGLLFVLETLRAARLRRRLPIDTHGAYFRRILASGRGERLRVAMVPYSYDPPARTLDTLQTALLDLFGSRSSLRRHEAVDYGGDPPPEDGALESADAETDGTRRTAAVLFNLAQTPEAEVHGDFLEAAAGRLVSPGETLAVIVDQSRYRQSLGPGEEGRRRLEERRRAWDRVAQGAGRRAAHVDLETMSAAEIHRVLNTVLEAENEVQRR